jgi:hypothetical protein
MSHELDRLNEEFSSYIGSKLADQVRFLTFDQLLRNFEQSIPSSTSILIPEWGTTEIRVESILSSPILFDARVSVVRLFERILRDNLLVKRFICEFREGVNVEHARYDLGSSTRRFYERARFGALLEEYELGRINTNLWETDTDVFLSMALTERGCLLRDLIIDLVPEGDLDQIWKEGWFHSCGRTSGEYVAYIKTHGWGSI